MIQIGEHEGHRVVDLVREPGGERARSREALAVGELELLLAERLGALLDEALQLVGARLGHRHRRGEAPDARRGEGNHEAQEAEREHGRQVDQPRARGEID